MLETGPEALNIQDRNRVAIFLKNTIHEWLTNSSGLTEQIAESLLARLTQQNLLRGDPKTAQFIAVTIGKLLTRKVDSDK